jgi:hypothetical protein
MKNIFTLMKTSHSDGDYETESPDLSSGNDLYDTARRLYELARAGMSTEEMAQKTDISPDAIKDILDWYSSDVLGESMVLEWISQQKGSTDPEDEETSFEKWMEQRGNEPDWKRQMELEEMLSRHRRDASVTANLDKYASGDPRQALVDLFDMGYLQEDPSNRPNNPRVSYRLTFQAEGILGTELSKRSEENNMVGYTKEEDTSRDEGWEHPEWDQ